MMRTRSQQFSRAFSLIEVMVAIAILSLVIAAIYSTWTAILRSSKASLQVAASVQRSRIAMQCIEEALTFTQMYTANIGWYSFEAESGNDAFLSFVTRLPESFPRGGKFGDLRVRRVTFSVEEGEGGDRELVLRQHPILMQPDEDEVENPLVLARNVDEMTFEFWDVQTEDWIDEWTLTNQLPLQVRVRLTTAQEKTSGKIVRDESTILVSPAAVAVQPAWQGVAARRGPQPRVPRR